MRGKYKMSGRQGKGQRPARIGKQGKTTDSDAKKAEKQESRVQFSVSMICTLVAALFILTFNVQAFEIPTGSMEPTLLVGDHLLVDRSDIEPQTNSSRLLPHHVVKHGDILNFFHLLSRNSTW
jgi:hypothetical protein